MDQHPKNSLFGETIIFLLIRRYQWWW